MLAGATVGLVLVLLTAGIVVATSTADRGPAPTTATFTGVPTTQAGTPPAVASRMTSAASALLPSTVALIVVRNGGTVEGTGVVAEAGGIIATLCSLVDGARSITAVEPDGARRPATLVATDPTSGIAVVRIDDDLPAATFATGDPAAGSLAWALSERVAAATAPPSARLYGGTVTASGRAQGTGAVAAFASTAVATPLTAADIGCPLVDRAGTVVGVLDQVVATSAGSSPSSSPPSWCGWWPTSSWPAARSSKERSVPTPPTHRAPAEPCWPTSIPTVPPPRPVWRPATS